MLEFMRGMMLASTMYQKLEKINEERLSASDMGAEECQKCGYCCWQRPCQLVKEDIPKIAKFLNISEKELFQKYLVVDKIRGILCILPRRGEQEDIAGQFVPMDRTYDLDTPCVFLNEDNICKIHEAKPAGGADHGCWKPYDEKIIEKYKWTTRDLESIGFDCDCLGYTDDSDY